MISISRYFFRQFIIASIVGYLLFFISAFLSAYQQAKMFSHQVELVLTSNFEEKKDKLLLFYALNDAKHFLSEIDDLRVNNLEYQLCSLNFSNSQNCNFKNYYFHPSEPRIKIHYQIKRDVFYKTIILSFVSFSNLVFLVLLTFLALIAHHFLKTKIIEPILRLNSFLDQFSTKDKFHDSFRSLSDLYEWHQVEKKIKLLLDKIHDLESDLVSDTTFLITRQVSHDIRSPLSALNMIIGQLTQIPEQQRLIIPNLGIEHLT